MSEIELLGALKAEKFTKPKCKQYCGTPCTMWQCNLTKEMWLEKCGKYNLKTNVTNKFLQIQYDDAIWQIKCYWKNVANARYQMECDKLNETNSVLQVYFDTWPNSMWECKLKIQCYKSNVTKAMGQMQCDKY